MMAISKDRMMHSIGVARLMEEEAAKSGHDFEYAKEMFLLGYLHDIGYEFASDQPEHNKIGGELLKSESYKYWKEVYYHGEVQREYSSEELTLLNRCDLLVSATGERVSIEERLADIQRRYGADSRQYEESLLLAKSVGLIQE